MSQYNLRVLNPTNTAANWTSLNPILLKGEIAFESDSSRFKIGDGITAWNDLPYSASSVQGLIEGDGIEIDGLEIGAALLYDIIDA